MRHKTHQYNAARTICYYLTAVCFYFPMPLVHTETMCWLTPHPTSPLLSMISAALCRSVQIESGMDEDVASRVWVYSPLPLVGKVPQQAEEETNSKIDRHIEVQADRKVWQGLGCAPPSPKLWVASFEWSFGCCTRTPCTAPVCWLTFFHHGMGMLYALHIPLSLAGSIAACSPCPSSVKSTVWTIRRPWPQVSFVCAHCSSCMQKHAEIKESLRPITSCSQHCFLKGAPITLAQQLPHQVPSASSKKKISLIFLVHSTYSPMLHTAPVFLIRPSLSTLWPDSQFPISSYKLC